MPHDALVQIAARPADPAAGPAWQDRLARLRELLRDLGSVVVAYSGGVDSSLVLRVAHEVLGERAVGVIGRSDSYAERELALALEQARSFGARVEVVATGELSDPRFRSNPADRCYHCKTELYRRLAEAAAQSGARAILDGTIADDLGDWRPGRRAAAERQVRSPLAELGFTKHDVREAVASFGLSSHDKPASPCLASRIPYGMEITREKLTMVEKGESLLRSFGFRELRLRHHGEVARVEVPLADLGRLIEPGVRERVVEGLKALGFRYVTLDLEGFRSGSLNAALGPRSSHAKPEFMRDLGGG
jgi:pyridinium-3,5-biscarboxylic acid mononucleotide sulfurtransferase